jgi:hypothetical protein
MEERMRHPSDLDLASFLAERLKSAARRRVVRHFLAGCDLCRTRMRVAFQTTNVAETEDVYDGCIDRALAAALAIDARRREEAQRCARDFALVRPKKGLPRLARLGESTWPQVETLLGLSFRARFRAPWEMLRFAELALAATKKLDPAVYGEAPLHDLQARVWAELGNAHRVIEDFDGAEAALIEARDCLEQGSEELMVQAFIDEAEASLRKDQRKLAEAEALLDRACRTYLKLGERHLAGRTLVTKGLCIVYAQRPLDAMPCLRRALSLLDAARDPQLVATAQHNLLLALAATGEYREASRVLLASGLRRTFADEPLNLLRLRWVEGKIMAGHGRLVEAERVLGEVVESFRARGLEYVAAIAGVDLAQVVLKKGGQEPLHALSLELHTRARERRLPEQACLGLKALEIVSRLQVAAPPYLERLQRFLVQLQHDPGLCFEPELMLIG